MTGKLAAVLVFMLIHVAYYMPYMAILILAAYLGFIIRDVSVFSSSEDATWEYTTALGKSLYDKQREMNQKAQQLQALVEKALQEASISKSPLQEEPSEGKIHA